MTTTQPEALALADRLEDHALVATRDEAAAMIRAQHAEIEALKAAGAGVPGWVLVPVEPTDAMLEAGQAEFRSYCFRHMFGHPAVWAAMLAAAPKPPEAQVDARDAETLARQFHETYERLAPSFGYVTREETREFNPTSPNGKLMIAVCAAIAAQRGEKG